MNSIFPSCRKC